MIAELGAAEIAADPRFEVGKSRMQNLQALIDELAPAFQGA